MLFKSKTTKYVEYLFYFLQKRVLILILCTSETLIFNFMFLCVKISEHFFYCCQVIVVEDDLCSPEAESPPPGVLRPIGVQSRELELRSAESDAGSSTLVGHGHEIGRCLFAEREESFYVRPNPLPSIDWADRREVWTAMQRKERLATYKRDPALFERHPGLHERMRAILIDWLIEVCVTSLYVHLD